MKYQVYWMPSAERRLTELWMASRYSSLITSAADLLDADLARRPSSLGESRADNLRVVFYAPLAVLFTVDEPSKRVEVVDVWLI